MAYFERVDSPDGTKIIDSKELVKALKEVSVYTEDQELIIFKTRNDNFFCFNTKTNKFYVSATSLGFGISTYISIEDLESVSLTPMYGFPSGEIKRMEDLSLDGSDFSIGITLLSSVEE